MERFNDMEDRRLKGHPCEYCGDPVPKWGMRFCSRECYDNSRRKQFYCEVCGKRFFRPNAKASFARFCSQECRNNQWEGRTHKRCPACTLELPVAMFSSNRASYCMTCDPIQAKIRRLRPANRFANSRCAAVSKGREWAIPFELYSSLIVMPCHYCLGPLDETGIGLDRVDTDGGYTPNNVVPCCGRCNSVKLDHFTYDEMMRLSEAIREIDRLRTVAKAT